MACCAKLQGGVTPAKADARCKGGEQRAHARADAGIVGVVLPEIRIVGVVVPPHILFDVFLL